MKRREFIPGLSAIVMGSLVAANVNAENYKHISHLDSPYGDDDFWAWIRSQFRTGDLINLNNGGVSPHPIPVEEAFFNYHRICNEVPTYNMWRVLEKNRQIVREKLAVLAGCESEEIAINRNATEALVTIIMNLPLEKGDEVVLSNYDYPRMMNAWKVREERDGIVLNWINPEVDNPDKETLIKRYTSQFTKRTKVVMITHMINWTGRMVPAKEIIAEARKNGIISIVDAAHSFAHLPFSVSDLNCDYLGASLHKWLAAPFGNGLLYVKKENIRNLPPFFPIEKDLENNIKKFEELGTRNNAAEFTISEAVDFHNLIGTERKYKRLLELRNYWIDKVKQHPKINIRTPLTEGESGAIALVEIEGKTGIEIDLHLFEHYKIHCVAIQHQEVDGVRITPNVYTSFADLDYLVKGLLELAS